MNRNPNHNTGARFSRIARIARFARIARTATIAGLALSAIALPASPASAQTVPAPIEQQLYGTSQWGSFEFVNYAGTSAMRFDDMTTSMTGQFAQATGSDWTFGTLQATSLKTVQSASLEVRFATANWKDDDFLLEYTTDNWATVRPLAAFGAANPAPSALKTYAFTGLEGVVANPAAANAVQVRFRTAPKAVTQPAGSNDRDRQEREQRETRERQERERKQHQDNGRGNDDRARQDNRNGSAVNTARIIATPTPAPARAISTAAQTTTTSTASTANAAETYTLSVDQVRLVVKGN